MKHTFSAASLCTSLLSSSMAFSDAIILLRSSRLEHHKSSGSRESAFLDTLMLASFTHLLRPSGRAVMLLQLTFKVLSSLNAQISSGRACSWLTDKSRTLIAFRSPMLFGTEVSLFLQRIRLCRWDRCLMFSWISCKLGHWLISR